MTDVKTLRLAMRPVTPELLEKFIRFIRGEHQGRDPSELFTELAIAPEDVARVGAAVNAFCRPRVLRVHLGRAKPKTAERHKKTQDTLAAQVDDSDFIALHGVESWQTLKARADELVALRTAAAEG